MVDGLACPKNARFTSGHRVQLAVKKMAPIKGPFSLPVHHVVVMVVVVMVHITGLCGRYGKRHGGKSGENKSNLLHEFLLELDFSVTMKR